jgi:hypothetical protein
MPSRLGAVLYAGLCCIAATSCATQESNTAITEQQAEEIGMRACHGSQPKPSEHWHWQARHRPWRNDIWQVWIAGDDNRYDSSGVQVEVFADGTAGECLEPVLSTG